ncbi:MAG TPA: hypothetical protein P5239_06170 [Victivallales bacterium]|nr:hypothetical protein [Victivallales bacterium]
MISPARKQVFISTEDGSREPFKPEELQSHIYHACIQCGIDDNWLSEDIALCVEYLILEAGHKTEFSKEEILLFTSRILEETGYSNVALRLKRNCGLKNAGNFDFSNEGLFSFLKSSGLFGDDYRHLENIVELLNSALSRLGIKNPEDELLIALAKHFHKNYSSLTVESRKTQSVALIISKEELTETIISRVPELLGWIENGVIHFHPVSVLFPALKFSFSFAKFAELKGLNPPVTELAIMPHLSEIATLINDSFEVFEILLRQRNQKEKHLPLIMRLTDSIEFAREYLLSDSGDDRIVREICNSLKDFISGELIIK